MNGPKTAADETDDCLYHLAIFALRVYQSDSQRYFLLTHSQLAYSNCKGLALKVIQDTPNISLLTLSFTDDF